MPPVVVQQGSVNGGQFLSSSTVTLGTAPTFGNLLLCAHYQRSGDANVGLPAGFTTLHALRHGGGGTGSQIIGYKIAGPAESNVFTAQKRAGTNDRLHVIEYGGGSFTYDAVSAPLETQSPSLTWNIPITITSGDVLILGGGRREWFGFFGTPTPAVTGGTVTDFGSCNGESPLCITGYRFVAAGAGGATTLQVTQNVNADDWGAWAGSFSFIPTPPPPVSTFWATVID